MAGRTPILVTGSHRSGSTWVGRMLALSPSVGYIHEPLHVNHRPGVCGANFDYWYFYITEKNESRYRSHIENMIRFNYNITQELSAISSLRDILRMIRDFTVFSWNRFRQARPLIKDPTATFSAKWLADTFDMEVVLLIRHPAAFISSLKRMNWTHSFSHFLKQPLLMKDHLERFRIDIEEYASREHDIIDQGTLLWNIVYSKVLDFMEQEDDWIFVRHEDLSRDPVREFQVLYERLGLEYTSKIESGVREYSKPSNPKEVYNESRALKRDSKANIYAWKNKLTPSEIQRIREATRDISINFYSDEEW